MKRKTHYLAVSALIAALYAGSTYMMAFFGLSYGPVQFRISEALTILPVFCPAAITGLTVGCFIANIFSYNPIDMLFGTAATLIASLLSYWLRRVKWWDLPVLAALMPVLVNGIIVGFEIAFFFTEGDATLKSFLLSGLWVALGELAVCLGLGLPLYKAISKNKSILEFIKN
ncbi:MAG: QueT transporter family protein [Clostridia bacterium]|nr:QueT transporter family protein [Clostridia bacterium]MBQ2316497.1 QueT transporter family protein [Clostridia bacterium]MEE0808567.1 QueT transporter family protein [Acutalibacteraceae bacterium]